jgi:hypothetical protein
MVVAVAVSIGCVLNVFSDDAAVRAAAETAACGRGGCVKASQISVERSPIAETVVYTMPGGTVSARCSRAAVLVGPYSCVKE